jgi:precorrin-6Y C5,15-methyltransferase (decarboxylating)
VSALNVIGIEVAAGPGSKIISLSPGLPDEIFESDGQLTKREVRAVTLAALAPRHGELLWDIGLGSGAIAIEWLLCHPSLGAIGIEEREDRAARAMRNALALGAPDLRVITGRAPEALAGLAPPDAVFIGGGFTDDGVFDAAWAALRPGGRIVANAVTLESEGRLKEAFDRHGGELVRIEISKAGKIGGFHGWRAAMPVTQWRAVKP